MSKPDPEVPPVPSMRLQRYLAQCGLGSRRECEELIEQGRVEIDGVTVDKLGSNVKPTIQTVTLDGENLKFERKRYYLLNKPPGFLCTAKDPQGRRTIFDLFPPEGPRLFCVGRLDEATTGLLIVTNDGDLSQKLAHPKHRIHRLYKAQVAGHPDREVFNQLKEGHYFTEGKFKVHDIRPIKKQGQSTWVEITMTEGQNREIRRLLARTGHKVMKLERIGFGPIRIGRVPIGQFRELRREELGKLFEILERNKAGGSTSPKKAGSRNADKKNADRKKMGSKAPSSKNVRGKKSATSGKSKSAGKKSTKKKVVGRNARNAKKKPRRGKR
ncbi:pseudouridine synthase [Thalassoglobus polymorphus]|uniref:Pseudouridine synthase n=1 Tax=Thalassoglobus polymorphus TaxID=2527994 RepID=A0A517QIC4_9PLAN|nr:pseudouridine synthase [Thalassoglobus polymorphus]QDT31382.1 Ribosomal large subunit pseudouridine synthase B [Thalassoglobus polymorphus]